jgi:SAM-dependent methyltransferase
VLERSTLLQDLYGPGWERAHPFDRAHGTDTSGTVAAARLPRHEAARVHAVGYAGSQPSVVRAALALLPPVHDCTFVDLGCGKGRALLVASERPFRDIVGVELSAPLAAIARANAARMARLHPRRAPIRVVEADAATFAVPAGDLVVFLYDPFGPGPMARVARNIEAALATGPRMIHVVYCNPAAASCFDACRRLQRCFTGALPYAAGEIGYGPGAEEQVVIWRGVAAERQHLD